MSEQIDMSKRRASLKKNLIGVGIALSVVALVVGIIFSANAGNNGKNPPKATETTKITASPSEKPANNTEKGLTTEIVKIPLGASKEELTTDLVKILNIQYDGNLNQKTVDVILNDTTGATIPESSRQIATQHMKASFDGQYISTWQQDSDLSGFFGYMVDRNAERIQIFSRGQGLTESQTLESAHLIEQSPQQSVISITTIDHYNDPQDAANTTKINGSVATQEFTLVPQGDHLVISKQVPKG